MLLPGSEGRTELLGAASQEHSCLQGWHLLHPAALASPCVGLDRGAALHGAELPWQWVTVPSRNKDMCLLLAAL